MLNQEILINPELSCAWHLKDHVFENIMKNGEFAPFP